MIKIKIFNSIESSFFLKRKNFFTFHLNTSIIRFINYVFNNIESNKNNIKIEILESFGFSKNNHKEALKNNFNNCYFYLETEDDFKSLRALIEGRAENEKINVFGELASIEILKKYFKEDVFNVIDISKYVCDYNYLTAANIKINTNLPISIGFNFYNGGLPSKEYFVPIKPFIDYESNNGSVKTIKNNLNLATKNISNICSVVVEDRSLPVENMINLNEIFIKNDIKNVYYNMMLIYEGALKQFFDNYSLKELMAIKSIDTINMSLNFNIYIKDKDKIENLDNLEDVKAIFNILFDNIFINLNLDSKISSGITIFPLYLNNYIFKKDQYNFYYFVYDKIMMLDFIKVNDSFISNKITEYKDKFIDIKNNIVVSYTNLNYNLHESFKKLKLFKNINEVFDI